MTTDTLPPFHPLTGHLPPGIHPASHEQLRHRCVDSLNKGRLRPEQREKLFTGYEKLVDAISMVSIETQQWIGGSFASNIDMPNDIDLVSFCDVLAYEQLAPEVRAMLKQFFMGEHTAKHCHCDSYFAPMPPEEHREDEDFLIIRRYWQKKLGQDVFGREKGIIERTLPNQMTADTEEQTNAAIA